MVRLVDNTQAPDAGSRSVPPRPAAAADPHAPEASVSARLRRRLRAVRKLLHQPAKRWHVRA